MPINSKKMILQIKHSLVTFTQYKIFNKFFNKQIFAFIKECKRRSKNMREIKLLYVLFALFLMVSGVFAQGTWTTQTNPVSGRDVNSASAVDANTCWMCGATTSTTLGYVIRTTNGGTTWTNVTGNMPSSTFGLYTVCGISATEAWVGASDGGVYHTTNGGTNWTFVTLPSPATAFVDVIHFFNQNIGFIIGDPSGGNWCYYWTTNAGVNWTWGPAPSASGTEAGWNNAYGVLDTHNIWYGTNNTKIYKGGLRSGFTAQTTVGVNSFGIAFCNATTGIATMTNASYAVLPNNVTVNGGTTWTAGFTPAGVQFGLKAIIGTPYVFMSGARTSGGGIYLSTNYGVNWTSIHTTGTSVYALAFANANTGWAGASGGSIYKWAGTLNEVNSNNTAIPTDYKLEQNYPNPFNPTTTINYSIPKASFVTLKIYDILGNEVKTIVNEYQTTNNYTYTADFSTLSSGIYYYTLKAGEFTATKKLMFVK